MPEQTISLTAPLRAQPFLLMPCRFILSHYQRAALLREAHFTGRGLQAGRMSLDQDRTSRDQMQEASPGTTCTAIAVE
eukprot:2842382-Rhodomonas_salina.2